MLIADAAQWLSAGLALATVPVLVGVHALAKGHRWGLPLAAVIQGASWWILISWSSPKSLTLGPADWLLGITLLGALWLGWFQIYSVLCRGFSLQLMVEIGPEAGAPPRSRDELADSYADGRGIGWLLKKRLDGLQATALAQLEGDSVVLRPAGRAVARMAGVYKRWTGIGAGG